MLNFDTLITNQNIFKGKYMKNFLALVLLTSPLVLFSQEQTRMGLTLGFGSTDYDFSIEFTDDGTIANNDADFSTSYVGFDYGIGKHTFNVILGSSGSEQIDQSGSAFDDYYYENRYHELEFEDISFNYIYRLNNNWQIGLGYNELTKDTTYDYYQDNDFPFDVWGAGSYRWTLNESLESTSDGLTVFAAYLAPIANNLFFTARLGYTQQDYEENGKWTDIFSGLSTEYNNCLSGNGCPDGYSYSGPSSDGLNGYGFSGDYTRSGDASAAVFGIGLAWSVNPKNLITFEYSVRSFDYGELDSSSSYSTSGYWAVSAGDDGFGTNQEVLDNAVEEDFGFFSVKWRYRIQ